jgi:hypothetical protein
MLVPYSDTHVYRYWQDMNMPEDHKCVECDKKLRPQALVYTYPFLDAEDGGAVCAPCACRLGFID